MWETSGQGRSACSVTLIASVFMKCFRSDPIYIQLLDINLPSSTLVNSQLENVSRGSNIFPGMEREREDQLHQIESTRATTAATHIRPERTNRQAAASKSSYLHHVLRNI